MKQKDMLTAVLSGIAGYMVGQWYYSHRLNDVEKKYKEINESLADTMTDRIETLEGQNEELEAKVNRMSDDEKDMNRRLLERSAKLAQEQAKNADLAHQVEDLKQVDITKLVIIQKDKNGNVVSISNTVDEAAETSGISAIAIKKVLIGAQKTAGGFFWTTNLVEER